MLGIALASMTYTVKKNADGLKEVKTNLRFFGLSYSFYFSF